MRLRKNAGRKERVMSLDVRSNAHESLGIDPDLQTGSKRKSSEEELRRGGETNKQRIAMVGVRLVESSQYPTIKEAFYEVDKWYQ